jgi:GT2 family glycosyltransferase
MSVQTPILSIVIVNSDGASDTLACLKSIFRCPPEAEFEVILVDNGSQDGCLSFVRRHYPQVRAFSAPERQGFAKNYNLGMRHARGEYVLILNNDTVVHEGALDALLTGMQQNPTYGMLGGKLLLSDGRIQPECARPFPTPFSYMLEQSVLIPCLPLGRLWRRYASWRSSKRPSGPVRCISGACMLTTRQVLRALGPLDEAYPSYFEDVEWCHRLQRHGKIVGYVAEAPITHYGDRAMSKMRVWSQQGAYRGALRYFQEYHALTPAKAWLLWLATAQSFHLRALAFLFQEKVLGKPGHASAYLQLSRWILDQRPGRAESSPTERSVTGDPTPEASASGSGAEPEYR